MAQSRLIPRTLPSMPYYNDLEPMAKLLYLSFWLEADDEGCFNPGMILASEGQTIKKDPFISLLARWNQFINPFIGPVIDNEIYTILDFFPTNKELLLQPYFQSSRYHQTLCKRYPWIEEYEYKVLNDVMHSAARPSESIYTFFLSIYQKADIVRFMCLFVYARLRIIPLSKPL